ncbi:MAG: acyltransferase [Pseudomonadota bacterium]
MKSLLRQSRGLLVFALLTLNTMVWFTPLFLLALVKLLIPIAGVRRGLTRALMAIGENWISVNAIILSPIGSRHWVPGDLPELRRDGWYLVVSNHQTWVDIVVLQTVFNRRIPFLKFFIKQELIWFPLLGIAWWALDMPFMKRYSPSYLAKHPEKKGHDLEATRRACEKFQHTPTSVINFVEGTRFSEDKREKRQSPFRRLLAPRAGGIAIALNSMGELFDGVVDVTIAYDGSTPTFWDMCCGQQVGARLHVALRELDASLFKGDYAGDREYRREVHRWLTQLWSDKDDRLEAMLADAS